MYQLTIITQLGKEREYHLIDFQARDMREAELEAKKKVLRRKFVKGWKIEKKKV